DRSPQMQPKVFEVIAEAHSRFGEEVVGIDVTIVLTHCWITEQGTRTGLRDQCGEERRIGPVSWCARRRRDAPRKARSAGGGADVSAIVASWPVWLKRLLHDSDGFSVEARCRQSRNRLFPSRSLSRRNQRR